MFKNIFRRQINNITIAATLVALSSLASRFLGIVRDHILAGQFGAGSTLDIYYTAFRVPDLVFSLIVLGALSAGFVPIFTALVKNFKCDRACRLQGHNKEAWALVTDVLNILLLALISVSLLGVIFTPVLIRLLAPGFGLAEQHATVTLTRIMFLSPLLLGVSGLLGGVLQSFKRFLIYSLAPIFYNLGIIIGALYFVNIWGISGLAWGVVLGAFMHMSIQIPMVRHLGFKYRFRINWRNTNVWKMGRMMIPRTLSLGVSQLNLVVITIIASGLSSGSLSVFNFANNLQSFPIGIFGISFAIAAFPVLSEFAFNNKKLVENFSFAIRQILFFIIPATVLIIVLRAQIVRVVLGTGNFNWQDTILTMNTLALFALSLFAQATIPLLVRVFYARHDSRTPFYLALISVTVNIVLSFVLAKQMGVVGLALAFSLASILNFILLWFRLHSTIGYLDLKKIIVSTLKFVVAALAAGVGAQITKVLVWPFIDMTRFKGIFVQLTLAFIVGTLIYALFCYLFKSEEFFNMMSALRKRIYFKKVIVNDQDEARGA